MARSFLNGIDLNNTQLLNALAQVLAADPALVAGKFYYHSGTGTLRFTDGTNVRVLGRLDQISAPTAPVSLNNQRITNLADPTASTDAATKSYIDALLQGFAWKDDVRAASTANVVIASGLVNATVLDGVTVATGDRVLLKNQTTASENGIYIVAASGAASRSADADSSGDVQAMTTFVNEGTANGDTAWTLTTNAPITLGTTALAFAKVFGGASSSVNKFSQTYGGSASQAIAHNLGTQDCQVIVRDATTNAQVEPDIVYTDANTVTLTEATAPAANSRRVVVIG